METYKVIVDEEALRHGLFSQWGYNGKTEQELLSLWNQTKQIIKADEAQASIFRKQVQQLKPLLTSSENEMNAAKVNLDNATNRFNIAKSNRDAKKSMYDNSKTSYNNIKNNYDSAVRNKNKYEKSVESNKNKLTEIEKALGKK